MSWDVDLVDNEGKIVEVVPHQEGGIIAMGGEDQATMNVTYNYAKHFYDNLPDPGFKWLNGKKAKDTIEILEKAVKELGTETSNDYWEATEGNAGRALSVLLSWAKQYPEAIFKIV